MARPAPEVPTSGGPPVRLIIADDSWLIRSALRDLVATFPDVELVAECVNGDELTQAVATHHPDVVITDIRMPPSGDGEGLRVAARLRDTHPDVGVIVLSQYEEAAYGRELLAGGAGGRGYLLKEGVHDRVGLQGAIRVVATGGTVIDPTMVARLLAAEERRDRRLGELTPREREVLALMAEGKSNATIADDLGLTKRAIEKHVGAIFLKLELADEELVSRRVAAVLLYLDGMA